MFPLFAENVRRYRGGEVIRPLMMPSLEAARLFPDASLDLVFIDGNHGHGHVKQDILAWLPKVRPGGILCGHDCDANYAKLCPALRAEIAPFCEQDTVKNTKHPGPPEFHGGVVRAVHEALGGTARLWFESRPSTVWSLRKPSGMLARFRIWLGLDAPPACDGPERAKTPWPATAAV
jgi:hypothetical protein